MIMLKVSHPMHTVYVYVYIYIHTYITSKLTCLCSNIGRSAKRRITCGLPDAYSERQSLRLCTAALPCSCTAGEWADAVSGTIAAVCVSEENAILITFSHRLLSGQLTQSRKGSRGGLEISFPLVTFKAAPVINKILSNVCFFSAPYTLLPPTQTLLPWFQVGRFLSRWLSHKRSCDNLPPLWTRLQRVFKMSLKTMKRHCSGDNGIVHSHLQYI